MSFAIVGSLLLGIAVVIGLIKQGELGCFGGAFILGSIFLAFVMVIITFIFTALSM